MQQVNQGGDAPVVHKTTIEFTGPVTREGLEKLLREQAPHLLRDEAPPHVKVTTRTEGHPETEKLLTPAEVATLFRVDPKTVTRWAKAGRLTSIKTLGGHRRYRESEVRALMAESLVRRGGQAA